MIRNKRRYPRVSSYIRACKRGEYGPPKADRVVSQGGKDMAEIDKFRGMFLAEACGDALGYPLDKLSVKKIIHLYGPFGLRTPVRTKKTQFQAQVSANTQTVLATADGIFWADAKHLDCAEGVYRGYMRWFYSQTGEEPRRGQRTWMRRQPHERVFCLVREKFMHARRSMGDTSLVALNSMERGSLKNKVNDNPNSEPLARSTPLGLLYAGNPKEAFYEGVRCAVLTHSHPISYYSAAAVAALVAGLAGGLSFPKALAEAVHLLSGADGTDEILATLEAAVQQANDHPAGREVPWSHIDSLTSFGTGEAAHEALAIAVYCVMACDDPFEAIVTAANHDGRSSVTAALTGAIEGVRFGADFLPRSWVEPLEQHELIDQVGEKVYETYEKARQSKNK